jgi:hypothetical protein
VAQDEQDDHYEDGDANRPSGPTAGYGDMSR